AARKTKQSIPAVHEPMSSGNLRFGGWPFNVLGNRMVDERRAFMALQLVVGDKKYSSWSLRAALAVELTGAACDEVPEPLFQPDRRARLLRHSPTGKVPVLLTEQGPIWDSLAIAEYLAERYPEAQLWPRDDYARAVARS